MGWVMESLVVECLHCGTSRVARRDRFKHLEAPECPECGYLGWAPVLELPESERRTTRLRRRGERRFPSVA
jgi:ssDNA-binding Zn-finger/Zn-ribbon topoisomerase 1